MFPHFICNAQLRKRCNKFLLYAWWIVYLVAKGTEVAHHSPFVHVLSNFPLHFEWSLCAWFVHSTEFYLTFYCHQENESASIVYYVCSIDCRRSIWILQDTICSQLGCRCINWCHFCSFWVCVWIVVPQFIINFVGIWLKLVNTKKVHEIFIQYTLTHNFTPKAFNITCKHILPHVSCKTCTQQAFTYEYMS